MKPIEYTLSFERLPESTLLLSGAPLPPPEQMPPADEWLIIATAPFVLDRVVTEQDVLHLKDQVANLIVFQKTPARLRVQWTQPGGKLAGKRFNNPCEKIFFGDLTFDAAKTHLLEGLELARVAVENELPPQPPILAQRA